MTEWANVSMGACARDRVDVRAYARTRARVYARAGSFDGRAAVPQLSVAKNNDECMIGERVNARASERVRADSLDGWVAIVVHLCVDRGE